MNRPRGLAPPAAAAPADAARGPGPAAAAARGDEPHRPVGIVAAALAVALLVGGLQAGRVEVHRLAARYAQAVAPRSLPIKTDQLTFQRAALQQPSLLPIFGTSELYCCANGFNAPQFFLHEPTGFEAFAVGYPLTADLFFAQDFAALGAALRGRRVVVSDSWWFFQPGGLGAPAYDHTFSPEIATVFTFDSALPLGLRQGIARRMLDYPASLQGRPVLRAGLRALAGGSIADLAGYYALLPLGRLDAWALEVRDAWLTWRWIRSQKALPARVAVRRQTLPWTRLLSRATALEARQTRGDPFGVQASFFRHRRPLFRAALALYRSGRSNRWGQVYGFPHQAVNNMLRSRSWTDLRLELAVLRALGARPLVWTMPLPGTWYDYTPWSEPARQVYYRRYLSVAAAAGVPALAFRAHDEDPGFIASPSHLSARGWVFADRALTLFWHGASLAAIRGALARLQAQVPARRAAGVRPAVGGRQASGGPGPQGRRRPPSRPGARSGPAAVPPPVTVLPIAAPGPRIPAAAGLTGGTVR